MATDEAYAELKERAAASKRLAEALKTEMGLPLVSSAITVGVGANGGLKLIIVADGIEGPEARRLIRAALDAGVRA